MSKTYQSDVVLGETYKHKHSKIKGTAMSIHFYLHGCCRVGILPKDSKDNSWLTFDETELESVKKKPVKSHNGPGGPRQEPKQIFTPK